MVLYNHLKKSYLLNNELFKKKSHLSHDLVNLRSYISETHANKHACEVVIDTNLRDDHANNIHISLNIV